MQEVKNIRQREAVLLGQGDVYAVICSCSLQLKVKGYAEALAQRESPGLVDARAERRMHDQLHAAAFIKKALGDDDVRGGDSAQHGPASHNVFNGLFRAGIVQPTFALEPFDSVQDFG